jgi:hypothetical protein
MNILRGPICLSVALFCLSLPGAERPGLGKLPDWVQVQVRAAQSQLPPGDTGAWVLLMRREVAYQGHGTVQVRCLRLVQILRGKGLEEAGFVQGGLREGAFSIKELKGWNLRPDGEMVRLGSKDKATFGNTTEASFDTTTATVAQLPRVTEGSLVAFEVLEEFTSLRNPFACPLLEQHPVRRWELDASVTNPLFSPRRGVLTEVRRIGFAPWLTNVPDAAAEGLVVVEALPPLPVGEAAVPKAADTLPSCEVRFTDPQWPASQALASWSALAGWYQGVFSPKVQPLAARDPVLEPGLPGLRTLWRWFGRELTYKQVYLTPERDNVPEPSAEVAKKRYGDCKDLACLFIALAQRAGFEGFPALARMQEGPILERDLAGPPRDRFDHVIVALRLERSLGLPAEVATPTGRYLLVDPTDPFTPLGRLSDAHRDSRVLICLAAAGQWATIPPAAILHGDLDIQLSGRADPDGGLSAEALLRETGDLWGLRNRAHALSAPQFRAYLETHCLDQALNGACEVISLGDPLELERPFEVRLKLSAPRTLTLQGSDWLFKPPLGLPALPPPLTRSGKPRQFPVESRGDGRVVLRGSITLPRPVRPVLAEHSGTTSFRQLAWKLATEENPAGCTLVFRVEQQRKDAAFPFSQLSLGLEAWKKDRSLVRSLLEDGLALRP